MAAKHGQSLPHLLPGEVTLLDYAADDSRDTLSPSDKEALVLQLAQQSQEQQLEKALLEQGMIYTARKYLAIPLLERLLPPFLPSNPTLCRARASFWRRCGRTTGNRRARVPRGASNVHRQEKSHAHNPHDRSYP